MIALILSPPPAEIAAFNRALDEATRKMDNAAVLALWEDDGTTLLPGMAAVEGKPALARFYDDVTKQLAGAKVTTQKSECRDVQLAGDWASEWCTTHQVIALGGGKPPIEQWGKMLLVLHKSADGKWRLHDEMWNQGVPPSATTKK